MDANGGVSPDDDLSPELRRLTSFASLPVLSKHDEFAQFIQLRLRGSSTTAGLPSWSSLNGPTLQSANSTSSLGSGGRVNSGSQLRTSGMGSLLLSEGSSPTRSPKHDSSDGAVSPALTSPLEGSPHGTPRDAALTPTHGVEGNANVSLQSRNTRQHRVLKTRLRSSSMASSAASSPNGTPQHSTLESPSPSHHRLHQTPGVGPTTLVEYEEEERRMVESLEAECSAAATMLMFKSERSIRAAEAASFRPQRTSVGPPLTPGTAPTASSPEIPLVHPGGERNSLSGSTGTGLPPLGARLSSGSNLADNSLASVASAGDSTGTSTDRSTSPQSIAAANKMNDTLGRDVTERFAQSYFTQLLTFMESNFPYIFVEGVEGSPLDDKDCLAVVESLMNLPHDLDGDMETIALPVAPGMRVTAATTPKTLLSWFYGNLQVKVAMNICKLSFAEWQGHLVDFAYHRNDDTFLESLPYPIRVALHLQRAQYEIHLIYPTVAEQERFPIFFTAQRRTDFYRRCLEVERRFTKDFEDPDNTISLQYQRGEVIGKGGFGVVYRCTNVSNGQFLALKEIPLHSGKEQEIRIEIEMLKTLSHKNVIKYYGCRFDRVEQRVMVLMEYCPRSLADVTRSSGSLTLSLVAHYARKVLDGLHYLHENHIIHRDVKAANVMVMESGEVRLTDFGTALNDNELPEPHKDPSTSQGGSRESERSVSFGTFNALEPESVLAPTPPPAATVISPPQAAEQEMTPLEADEKPKEDEPHPLTSLGDDIGTSAASAETPLKRSDTVQPEFDEPNTTPRTPLTMLDENGSNGSAPEEGRGRSPSYDTYEREQMEALLRAQRAKRNERRRSTLMSMSALQTGPPKVPKPPLRRAVVQGTPLFLAPEVLRGALPCEHTDIWAFGCLLMELVTGHAPWHHEFFAEGGMGKEMALYKISQTTTPPQLPPDITVSDDFRDFLYSALQIDPAKRPTAEQLRNHPFLTLAAQQVVSQQSAFSSDLEVSARNLSIDNQSTFTESSAEVVGPAFRAKSLSSSTLPTTSPHSSRQSGTGFNVPTEDSPLLRTLNTTTDR